jgi:mannan polymerase II complex MNN11 subunit
LTKLALVPQNILNSYTSLAGMEEGTYKDGDFVVHLHGCDMPERSCEKEFAQYWEKKGVAA